MQMAELALLAWRDVAVMTKAFGTDVSGSIGVDDNDSDKEGHCGLQREGVEEKNGLILWSSASQLLLCGRVALMCWVSVVFEGSLVVKMWFKKRGGLCSGQHICSGDLAASMAVVAPAALRGSTCCC
jgi:hypothetical protein